MEDACVLPEPKFLDTPRVSLSEIVIENKLLKENQLVNSE